MSLIKKPSQQRSKETQERILDAYEGLLAGYFHEDITVRQIAKVAGISPASIYRRFENKDALLPVLYSRYENRLKTWAEEFWTPERLNDRKSATERIRYIVQQHVTFFRENAAMTRTLYLKTRASGSGLGFQSTFDRKQAYADMFEPVWDTLSPDEKPRAMQKGPLLILILISSVTEAIIFGDQQLAQLIGLDDENFSIQLGELLAGHISGPT